MRLKSAIQKCTNLGSNCVGVHGRKCTSSPDIEEYRLCKSGTVSTCYDATNCCKLGQKILAQGRDYEISYLI